MGLEGMEIENWVSHERFINYLQRCDFNRSKAIKYYEANIKVRESSYVYIQALEILLRNKIHFVLSNYYKTDNWFEI